MWVLFAARIFLKPRFKENGKENEQDVTDTKYRE